MFLKQVLAYPTTILQPNVQKRRSVTKLKSEDFTGDKATNYCLTTHNIASDGEMETKLLKVLL